MTLLAAKEYMKYRGFRNTTRDKYELTIKDFIKFMKKNPKKINNDDIKAYIAHLMNRDLKPSSINTKIRIAKFYLRDVLQTHDDDLLRKIKPLKEAQHIVDSLSDEELKNLLESITHDKHKLIFMLCYGSGLRIEEAVAFKLEYLETKILKGGKGNKDRHLIFSEIFLKATENYLPKLKKNWGESEYLFPSNNKSGHIMPRTFQEAFGRYAIKCGIKRRITPHILRKSFATILLSKGYDSFVIRDLLGHSDIRTTQRYARTSKELLSKVESPL